MRGTGDRRREPRRIHRGVARLVGTAIRRRNGSWLACSLSDRMRCVAPICGLPAGHPDRRPPSVDVIDVRTTGRSSEVVGLEGVVVHRPRDLGRLRPHRIDGIPCTNVLRTLADLGAVDLRPSTAQSVTCSRPSSADLNAIESAPRRTCRKGSHRDCSTASAIDDWSLDAKPADSVLESAMKRLSSSSRLASRRVPCRSSAARGRLPGHRDADRDRVRRVAVPRRDPGSVRT